MFVYVSVKVEQRNRRGWGGCPFNGGPRRAPPPPFVIPAPCCLPVAALRSAAHSRLPLFTLSAHGRRVEHSTGACARQQMIHNCKTSAQSQGCWRKKAQNVPVFVAQGHERELDHRTNMSQRSVCDRVCVCTKEAGAESWWKLNLLNSSAA